MTRATQDSHPSKNQRMPSFAAAKLAEKYQKRLASKDSTSCHAGQVKNMLNCHAARLQTGGLLYFVKNQFAWLLQNLWFQTK